MKKIIVALVLLALAPQLFAQGIVESHSARRDRFYCEQIADSSSFAAAEAKTGMSDAQIVAQMRGLGLMPLVDSYRLTVEKVSADLTVNEVISASFGNCMRGFGRQP